MRPRYVVDLAPGYLGVYIPIWKLYSKNLVVGLSPHVGVLAVDLEDEIKRRWPQASRVSTYQTHLVNLVPGRTFPQSGLDFLFDAGDEGRQAMDWFIDAMRSTAIPWMTKLGSDEGLAAEIFRHDDLPGTASDVDIGTTAPLLEIRLGHPDRALARLERHVAAVESRRDAIGDGYREFADRLRNELTRAITEAPRPENRHPSG